MTTKTHTTPTHILPNLTGRFHPLRICHTTALFGLSKNISMTNKEE